jgi:hypothetical protein
MPKVTDPALLSQLGQPEQQGMSGGIVIRPGDPNKAVLTQLEIEQKRQALAAQQRDAGLYDAQRRKAEADAAKAERDALGGPLEVSPERAEGLRTLAQDEILAAIDKARRGISGFSTGLPGQILSNVGGTGARGLSTNLNTVASRLTLDKLAGLKQLSSTGASGLGSLTEREGALLRDSVAGIDQFQSSEALTESLNEVERHYRAMRALQDGKDPRDETVQREYGFAKDGAPSVADKSTVYQAGDGPGREGGTQLATGGYKMQGDPALKGVNAKVSSLVKSGASKEQIVAYLQSAGIDPSGVSLDPALAFRAKNPSYSGGYPVDVGYRNVPVTPARQLFNAVQNSPLGNYAVNAADAVTMGNLDSMTDNPALTRAGMAQVNEQNPISGLTGQVSGGVMGTLGIGKALGAAAKAVPALSPLASPLAAEVAYGAGYGAGNSDEGNRALGAAIGAGLGFVGGKAGQKVASGLGSALTGVTDPAVQTLAANKVRMTPLQMLGGAAKRREDRLAGFGGIGDKIVDARRAGVQDFNERVASQVGAPLGITNPGVGQAAADVLQTASSSTYDNALSQMGMVPDAQFAQEFGALQRDHATRGLLSNDQLAQVAKNISSNVGGRMREGALTGPAFKRAVSEMRGDAASADAPVGEAIKGYAGALMDAARRQSHPDAVRLLDAADASYGPLQVFNEAVYAAKNQPGQLFTPAQLGNKAGANATKFGGRSKAARGDVPFNELQQAAQAVLPSTIPDSGTAGRIEVGDGLTAMLRATARNAVYAPLYSETLTPLISAALLKRTPKMIKAGKAVKNNKSLGSLLGAPTALGLPTYLGGGN